MRLNYKTHNGKEYSYSYSELKRNYEYYVNLSDAEFLSSANTAIHLACAIAFYKELEASCVLADDGIIHLLAHIITGTMGDTTLQEIRELFNLVLKLD